MNNQEQNNENEERGENEGFFDKVSSKDILCLSSDIIPSSLYIVFIYSALIMTPNPCDPNIPILLKAFSIIFSCFIIKGFAQTLLIHLNKINLFSSKVSLSTIEFIVYVCYYIDIILSYKVFKKLPDNCFIKNTFGISVLFCLILLGIINISRQILNLITVIIFFPIMVYNFFENPRNFYSRFGIDPEIVKNLPTKKADKAHCGNCVICAEDINEGDEILILRCPGKHWFHSNCIKSWLMVKVTCPMCRNEDIL